MRSGHRFSPPGAKGAESAERWVNEVTRRRLLIGAGSALALAPFAKVALAGRGPAAPPGGGDRLNAGRQGGRVDGPGTDPASVFAVYFIHLSTGENWLAGSYGGLRKAVNKATTPAGHSFAMHDSHSGNCDHREWPDRFNDDDWQDYDVVMFKSCFPASHIDSNRMLKEYKKVYRKRLAKLFGQYPGILFIVVTAPPLVPNETDQAAADRARKFNNWLKRKLVKKYNRSNPGLNNLAVFDFFDVLANDSEPDRNMLRTAYRTGPGDSHPNEAGSRQATEEFLPFLETATDAWAAGG